MMRARAVGGRAALLVAALLACDVPPARTAADRWWPAADAPAPLPAPAPARARVPGGDAVEAEARPRGGHARAPSRVVLVTVDGVRWEDVLSEAARAEGPDGGRGADVVMPNLLRLVGDRGVALGGPGCAHDVRASGPNFVSLPGYLEIFTGRPTDCRHNGCAPVDTATVVDEARAAVAASSDVAVFSSWSTYARAVTRDREAIALSAGARAASIGDDDPELASLLEEGARHAGRPGWGDYRPDRYTSRIALRYLEAIRPRLLVVGLGDADEHAHRGDFAGYRRAIRRADDFVGALARALARMGEDGEETAVIVTTDHGRARTLRGHGGRFPESQRVFVAAFGAGIARRGVACASEPLRLSHVAGAVRALLSLDSEAAPGPLATEIVDDELFGPAAIASERARAR